MEKLVFNVIEEQRIESIISKLESIDKKLDAQAKEKSSGIIEDEYLTRKQVSKLLKVSRQTLSNWNKSGVLKAIRIGTRVRYKKEDIFKLKP